MQNTLLKIIGNIGLETMANFHLLPHFNGANLLMYVRIGTEYTLNLHKSVEIGIEYAVNIHKNVEHGL